MKAPDCGKSVDNENDEHQISRSQRTGADDMFGIRLFRRDKGVSATIGVWEKTSTFFPVRLIDGTMSYEDGQLWRRRSPSGFQYRQDDPTWEEREMQAW